MLKKDDRQNRSSTFFRDTVKSAIGGRRWGDKSIGQSDVSRKKEVANNEAEQNPKTPSFMKIYDPYAQFDKSRST